VNEPAFFALRSLGIPVVKTAGAGLLWGILATATEEGSFAVTVGQNP